MEEKYFTGNTNRISYAATMKSQCEAYAEEIRSSLGGCSQEYLMKIFEKLEQLHEFARDIASRFAKLRNEGVMKIISKEIAGRLVLKNQQAKPKQEAVPQESSSSASQAPSAPESLAADEEEPGEHHILVTIA